MRYPGTRYHCNNRRYTQGSALMAAVLVVFIAMTAVLALHQQQQMARRTSTQAEAELRYREGRRWAVGQQVVPGLTAPSDLLVTAKLTDTTPANASAIPAGYGAKLFPRQLPNLKTLDAAAGHHYFDVKEKSSDSALQLFDKKPYKMVESDIAGYAAYAPKGKIDLDLVEAWGNPSFQEATNDTLTAYSGVPTLLGAGSDIHVGDMAYGEAHSLSGAVKLDQGQGVGFTGPLPLAPYEDQIMSQAQAAMGNLTDSTLTGDKSRFFNAPELTLSSMIDLLFSGNLNEDTLTSLIGLHQAFAFPMPIIPGVQLVAPPLVFNIWFHVPFLPDGGMLDANDPKVQQLQALGTQSDTLNQTVQDDQKALQQAIDERKQAEKGGNLAAIDAAKQKETAAQDKLKSDQQALENVGAQSQALVNSLAQNGSSSLPQTRNQDPSGLDGVFGWNYSKVIGNIVGLLTDTIKGDFKDIASRISDKVRLVHFGRADNVPVFVFGSPFVCQATLDVPQGRALQFNSSVEIHGDLWLQRGSVMTVAGDLNLKAPGAPSSTDPFKPSGRLFLEEGASLIVHGNFQCQGTPEFGSVMIGGTPDQIHPITASLMCEGNALVPFGVHSGSTLDELIPVPQMQKALQGLFESGAANAAKVAGPFHIRHPYFAEFATTFHLIIVPPIPPFTFTPVPVPIPTPLPKKNILVLAFRALSLGYTATLNATLGENLYTHADWWPFGDGVVPMTTKLDPTAVGQSLVNALGLLGSGQLSELEKIPQKVKDFGQSFLGTVMSWAIHEGTQQLVQQVAQMLPLFPPGLDDAIILIKDACTSKEHDADVVFATFVQQINDQLGSASTQLLGGILGHPDLSDYSKWVREHSGMLLFAGGDITVSSQAQVMAGMLVAGGSIDDQADLTIGTLMARNGSLKAHRLLYYPYFNQASLYVPKAVPAKWMDEAMQTDYGTSIDSGVAVPVGPPPVAHRITAEGWQN